MEDRTKLEMVAAELDGLYARQAATELLIWNFVADFVRLTDDAGGFFARVAGNVERQLERAAVEATEAERDMAATALNHFRQQSAQFMANFARPGDKGAH